VFRDIGGRGTVQKETKGVAMGRKRGSEKTKQAGRGGVCAPPGSQRIQSQ